MKPLVYHASTQTHSVSSQTIKKLKDFMLENIKNFRRSCTVSLVPNILKIQTQETTLQHAIFSSSIVTNLINDLLDLAKLEANTFSFNSEYFNLVELITEAFNQVKFLAN